MSVCITIIQSLLTIFIHIHFSTFFCHHHFCHFIRPVLHKNLIIFEHHCWHRSYIIHLLFSVCCSVISISISFIHFCELDLRRFSDGEHLKATTFYFYLNIEHSFLTAGALWKFTWFLFLCCVYLLFLFSANTIFSFTSSLSVDSYPKLVELKKLAKESAVVSIFLDAELLRQFQTKIKTVKRYDFISSNVPFFLASDFR